MKHIDTRWGAALLMTLFLVACVEDGQVNIYLIKSSDLSKEPLTPELTSHVRVRVTGPGMRPKERVSSYKAGGATAVTNIPQGEGRVITVEGLVNEEGIAMSRGRTLPIDIDGGKQSVTLFIARVDRFSDAPKNGLKAPRFGHVVMSSDEGYLYVAGGASDGDPTSPEEFRQNVVVIDPTDVSVRDLECGSACRLAPRVFGVAIPMANGFLLTGGIGQGGALVESVDFIDMQHETVRSHSINLVPRVHASSIVFDTKTVVAGGIDDEGAPMDTVEIIDRTGAVTERVLPGGRYGMTAGRAGNKGLFFGGYTKEGTISGDVYLFDADSNILSTLDADLTPRAHAGALSLADGRLLILGGVTEEGRASGEVDLFDPAVGAVCPVGQLAVERWHLSAAPLRDGRVLIIGGLTGALPGQPTRDMRILDPRYTNITSSCEGVDERRFPEGGGEQTSAPRYLSSATLMANGNVALIGGLDDDNDALQQIEVYVPPENE